jgi:hypothetical protein
MAQIYEFTNGAGSGYRSMTFIHDDDWHPRRWEAMKSLTSIASKWIPPKVRFLDAGETGFSDNSPIEQTGITTDMPWLGDSGILVVSQRFTDIVGDLFSPYGEFLPCDCEQRRFYMFHCTHELDAIDFPQSDVNRNDSGQITSERRIAFRPEVISDDAVFRCKFKHHSDVYCGKNVFDAMRRFPIKGATARLVWREGAPAIDISFEAFLDSLNNV